MGINNLPKQFKGLGLRHPESPKRRRLVAAVEADTKCGKTRLIFTMPKPLLIVSIDMNTEGQEDEAVATGEKDVYLYDVKVPDEVDGPKDLALFKTIRQTVYDSVETKFFRSIAIDTGDGLWDLCQRGFFGKTGFGAGGMQSNYAVPNTAMSRMFRTVRDSNDVNFLITQRVREEREDYISDSGKKASRTTGKMIMSGWRHTRYEVHAMIRLTKEDPEEFECSKSKCQTRAGCVDPEAHIVNRFKAKIVEAQYGGEGTVLRGSDITFANIAMTLYPATQENPEVWE